MSHRYSLRKRRGGEDNGEQPMNFRHGDDIDEPVVLQMKLTDVNNDCLEQIFLFLSLEDLLNIAHTNKQLKPAADLAFVRKFGGKKAQFVAWGYLYLTDGYAKYYNVRNPFRLLRCFGHLIPNHEHSKSKLLPYVNQYCRESITEIKFSGMSYNDFNGLKMPFVNAKTVIFFSCRLNGKFDCRLNTLFPNIRYLGLYYSEIKLKHIEVYFPHLEELKICGPITMQTKNFVIMFELNPQLRRLVLYGKYTTKFIRAASQHLHLLEYLYISSDKDFTDFGDEIARFPCLKKLSICCEDELTTNIPIESECLEEFTIAFHYDNSEKVINFLEKHPSIIKLCLTTWFKLNEDIVIKIINALPLLEKVRLLGAVTLVNVAIRFITNCKFLKKLEFEVIGYGKFEQIKKVLSEEWEPSYQDLTITVVKRET